MAIKPVFALDVGTRKVAGLILAPKPQGHHIQAAAIVEHQQRAMLDGQIHDIPEVALAVQAVKEKLEEKTNSSLNKVAVAAAGRALKTQQATAKKQILPEQEITLQDILTLEAIAVQEAEEQLIRDNKKLQTYHCVGYSVVEYNLDGSPIGNLVGQRGQNMGVGIIATFLPRIVVDSLITTLDRVGLTLSSFTLEPIAASAVAVPAAMRGLNLVLVDIGAGTSDIALTGQGTITGYAMVPAAGDEISEALSQALLVDFNTAEMIKRQLNSNEQITFDNVVGSKCTLKAEEIIASIKETITELARQIANQILLINKRAPQAVLLIGGGSLTPGLPEALAGQLEISKERIAVRGREVLKDIYGAENLQGPQAITPIGIAVTALHQENLGQAKVIINGRPIHFLAGQKINVTQALLAASIPARQLYGRPGKGLGVEINGQLTFLKGKPGQMGSIKVNNIPATLETLLKPGDVIEVGRGQPGEDARGTVKDLLPQTIPKTVTINGHPYTLRPQIFMNGSAVDYETAIIDKAKIIYKPLDTVAQVLESLGKEYKETILLNDQSVGPEAVVKDGDVLQTNVKADNHSINVTLNGKPVSLKLQAGKVLFADIFNHLDFSSTPPPGRTKLVMEVNNTPAKFTTPLTEGDRIILHWESEIKDKKH